MNQTFNFSRFTSLLKRYLVVNRKQLIFLYGVMIGITILVAAIVGNAERESAPEASFGALLLEELIFMGFILMGFSCIISSNMFSSLQSKTSRITTLMLPASSAEKYWVHFSVYIIGFYIMAIIASVLNDITISLCSGLPLEFSMVYFLRESDVELVAFFIFYQAVFALGSVIWPKRSFFKTFFALFLITILSIFNHSLILSLLYPILNYFYILIFSLAALCYVFAWLRFRKVQVIQKFL